MEPIKSEIKEMNFINSRFEELETEKVRSQKLMENITDEQGKMISTYYDLN